MATVKDVARLAGVSTATVSRVLNQVGFVEPATSKAVLDAVDNLAYRRDINWRRLSKQSSETICFLSGDRDGVNSTLVKTLVASERILNEAGYDLAFQTFRYAPDQPAARLRLPHLIADKGGVDGVILADIHYGNMLETLARYEVPYVGLGNNILAADDLLKKDLLFYDDISALQRLTGSLIESGHRRIAFVGTPEPWFRRRRSGYRMAMEQGGLPSMEIQEAWNLSNIEYGRRAAARLLYLPQRPTAILAGNDEIAAGVWNELINRNVKIPEEISLAGFGDREEFSVLEPALTSIAVSPERIGSELARMLLTKLSKPNTRLESRTMECEIMLRRSCCTSQVAAQRGA